MAGTCRGDDEKRRGFRRGIQMINTEQKPTKRTVAETGLGQTYCRESTCRLMVLKSATAVGPCRWLRCRLLWYGGEAVMVTRAYQGNKVPERDLAGVWVLQVDDRVLAEDHQS